MAAISVRERSFKKASELAFALAAGGSSLLGCAGVSRVDERNNTRQAKALQAAGCCKPCEEVASCGRCGRPELHRMLDHLRESGTVVVWRLDRLSRSLKDVLHIMERIAAAAPGSGRWPSTSKPPRLQVGWSCGWSAASPNSERAMIREYTSAGLAVARAEGRVGGRRRKPDVATPREIDDDVITGRKSGAEMARPHDVCQPTVSRIAAQHRMQAR